MEKTETQKHHDVVDVMVDRIVMLRRQLSDYQQKHNDAHEQHIHDTDTIKKQQLRIQELELDAKRTENSWVYKLKKEADEELRKIRAEVVILQGHLKSYRDGSEVKLMSERINSLSEQRSVLSVEVKRLDNEVSNLSDNQAELIQHNKNLQGEVALLKSQNDADKEKIAQQYTALTGFIELRAWADKIEELMVESSAETLKYIEEKKRIYGYANITRL